MGSEMCIRDRERTVGVTDTRQQQKASNRARHSTIEIYFYCPGVAGQKHMAGLETRRGTGRVQVAHSRVLRICRTRVPRRIFLLIV